MTGSTSVSTDVHSPSSSPPFPPALPTANSDDHIPFDFSAIVEQGVQAGLASMSSGSNTMPMDAPLPLHPQPGNLITPSQSQRTAVDEIRALGQDSSAHAGETGRPKRVTRKRAADGAVKFNQDVGPSSGNIPKRRRKQKTLADDSELDDETSDTSSKRKRKSKTPRRSRAPSVPVFDPDADPGEELDPTVVTMATLCDDTGQGRISSKAAQILSNHAAWKKTNREKRARMRILMEAKKYGRNEEDVDTAAASQPILPENAAPGPSTTPSRAASPSYPSEAQIQTGDVSAERTRDGFDYTESVATSRFNVQIRIGPSGETIVDEESLFVDRVEEHETEHYTHIEESDTTKFVNSATYGKKFRGSRWSAEETELFFDALSQFGENYELISYVLPGRDRKSCKNKFKIEDKKNPSRIDYCLKNRTPYDMQTLSRMTGKDFSGPAPIIRARTPPNMGQQAGGETQSPNAVRKQSRTPGPGDESSASAANGNKGPSGSAASAVERPISPELRKKQARKKKEDVDVEVLGTIDGDWD
ncbi:hypothetical protein EWM64_g4560 [Hericium alpestre]|uniref:Uncharacterized protein n=1 Tax=Hericium alpestre TaxID=135208 RepID=A0A4Z0A0Y4_9AGAM|nr:hypothetical protein EWM64_g4560 [Hericium alpestre]